MTGRELAYRVVLDPLDVSRRRARRQARSAWDRGDVALVLTTATRAQLARMTTEATALGWIHQSSGGRLFGWSATLTRPIPDTGQFSPRTLARWRAAGRL